MIQAAFGGAPFSAQVELWLEYDDSRIALSHVAPNFVRAQQPHDLPPGQAVLVVSVNGVPQRKSVILADGMSVNDTQTPMRPVDSVPF